MMDSEKRLGSEELVDTMRQCGNIALGCGECQFKIYRGHDAGCIRSLMTAAADRLEEYVDRCVRFSEEIMVLRERGRWIPVEERLPERDDCVAVCVSGKPQTNIILQNAVELATFSGKEGWILEFWPEWESADVTHWMPLPPAPEEETE